MAGREALEAERVVLEGVRELFAGHPERLARGVSARDWPSGALPLGMDCDPKSARARSWSLLGAVEHVAAARYPRFWPVVVDEVALLLGDALARRGTDVPVWAWADGATLEQLLELVRWVGEGER